MRLMKIVSMLLLLAAPAHASDGEAWVGDWSGILDAGGTRLPLVFHVTAGDEGLVASMDSPSQGAFGFAADRVHATADSLVIRFERLTGRLEGTGDPATHFEGVWVQAGMAFALELARNDGVDPSTIETAARPQDPECPCPYTDEDVRFRNERAQIELAGTFTRPEGDGPFPGVVLVSGSGPQDRDASMFGHRSFLVLADHLARHGIAVLRYDERGVGASEGDQESSTTSILSHDTQAAVDFLRAQDGIDAVGIMGHSEGGAIAPLVASRDPELDFIVLMAGPGTTGRQILAAQTRAGLEVLGIDPAVIDALVAANLEATKAVAEAAPEEDLEPAVREAFGGAADVLDAETRAMLALDDADAWLATNVRMLSTPWFRAFARFDPAPALQKVTCPVLAVNGALDLQVLPEENLAGIEAALAHNDDVTIRELPSLNHLFQTATTGSAEEYGAIDETLAPVFLDTVTDWILARFGD